MEPRDIYKLLYQGVRGPEHLIASPKSFADRLAEEWNALDVVEGDPLWESIRPDGSLRRLNLRPYKTQGGRLDELVIACLETGKRIWGTQADLQRAWENFAAACRDGLWSSLDLLEVESFTRWLATNGYPSVHHSEQYRSLYRPAYRLVSAEERFQALNSSSATLTSLDISP